ncbi:MAG TPA: rhomboid family intramembrane serine protease, partial [Jatrophihabitans sp.]|nr:rhomboid family intramembrane serine protease [Jatrophihabitans sp.]
MQPTPAAPDENYGFAGCYRHPDRLTGVRCVRCGRPICPQCQRPAAVGFQCPDDVRAGRASVRRPRTVAGARVRTGVPVVSYALIALNVLIYLVTALSPGGTLADNTGSKLFADWELAPLLVGADHDYQRLLTAAFLHFGPVHLLLNMLALYLVGPALEQVLGWWRYLAVYLLGALGGSVAILAFGDIRQPVVGASGAIFGLFAAAVVLARRVGFNSTALWITIGINFVYTFSVANISKLGHVGGFVFGGLAALVLVGGRPAGRLPSVRLQVAGLSVLFAVLLLTATARTEQLHSQLTSGSAARPAAPGPAPAHQPASSAHESASSAYRPASSTVGTPASDQPSST